jgi:hypothetical protein
MAVTRDGHQGIGGAEIDADRWCHFTGMGQRRFARFKNFQDLHA